MNSPCASHSIPDTLYVAVDIETNCSQQVADTVCADDGSEHPNLCTLLLEGKRFANMGRCSKNCKTTGAVCGYNSETFLSECSAMANRVGVDYGGRCVTVGGKAGRNTSVTFPIIVVSCVFREGFPKYMRSRLR